jgi:hypothetical protein
LRPDPAALAARTGGAGGGADRDRGGALVVVRLERDGAGRRVVWNSECEAAAPVAHGGEFAVERNGLACVLGASHHDEQAGENFRISQPDAGLGRWERHAHHAHARKRNTPDAHSNSSRCYPFGFTGWREMVGSEAPPGGLLSSR